MVVSCELTLSKSFMYVGILCSGALRSTCGGELHMHPCQLKSCWWALCAIVHSNALCCHCSGGCHMMKGKRHCHAHAVQGVVPANTYIRCSPHLAVTAQRPWWPFDAAAPYPCKQPSPFTSVAMQVALVPPWWLRGVVLDAVHVRLLVQHSVRHQRPLIGASSLCSCRLARCNCACTRRMYSSVKRLAACIYSA